MYPGQYCVDVAQRSNGILEGPLLIHCDPKPFSGQITKCCPKGQMLSLNGKNCILKSESSKNTALLAPRLIRDPQSGMTSSHYHLEEFRGKLSPLPCQNGSIAVFRHPVYVFTNGTAYFHEGEQLVSKNYQCLDNFSTDRG